eukprot:1785637-Rhodomonas_salina.1
MPHAAQMTRWSRWKSRTRRMFRLKQQWKPRTVLRQRRSKTAHAKTLYKTSPHKTRPSQSLRKIHRMYPQCRAA